MKVSQARDQLNGLPVTSDLVEVVGKAVVKFRSAVQQSYSIKRTISPQARLDLVAQLQGSLHAARKSLACLDYNFVNAPAARALEGEGLHLDEDHPQHIEIMLLFGNVYVEELEAALARLEGHERKLSGHFASLLNPESTGCVTGASPSNQTTISPSGQPIIEKAEAVAEDGKTVKELIATYVAEKEGGWAVATRESNRNCLAVLSELFGDVRVSSFTRQDARRVLETLKVLPKGARRNANLKEFPFIKCIEEGKRLGVPPLSAKTINSKYVSTFKAMFGWAVLEGWQLPIILNIWP